MHPPSPARAPAHLQTLVLLGVVFGSSLALGWTCRWVTTPSAGPAHTAPAAAGPSGQAAETDGSRAFEVAAERAADSSDYWARGLPGGDLRSTVVANLIDRLTVLDPAEAIRQVAALRADHAKLAAIYQTLAEKDVPGTLEAVLKLPPNDASAALGGVMKSWTARDPAAVAAFLTARGGTDLAELGPSIVSSWAARDPVAACRWCEVLPPGQHRNGARSSVVTAWAQTDAPAAAAYALTVDRTGNYDLVGDALREWAHRDLTGAPTFM